MPRSENEIVADYDKLCNEAKQYPVEFQNQLGCPVQIKKEDWKIELFAFIVAVIVGFIVMSLLP